MTTEIPSGKHNIQSLSHFVPTDCQVVGEWHRQGRDAVSFYTALSSFQFINSRAESSDQPNQVSNQGRDAEAVHVR